MKRLSVVFLALCMAIGGIDTSPIGGRSQTIVQPRAVNEISLRLLPPELPHDHSHYHHHHQAATTPATTTTTLATTTTKRPQSSSSSAEIVRSEYETFPDGGYRFSYETSDGQTRDEVGYFRDDEKLGKILTVRGSYSYIGDEGKQYIVRYSADENGYRQEEGLPPPDPQFLQPHIVATLAG